MNKLKSNHIKPNTTTEKNNITVFEIVLIEWMFTVLLRFTAFNPIYKFYYLVTYTQ